MIEIYELSTPGRVRWRESFVVEGWGVRDLEVVGDRLLISQFDAGLWTARVDGSGGLEQLARAQVEGDVRFTVGLGDRLVCLLADRGDRGSKLRLLDAVTLAELDRLEPPAAVTLDQARGGLSPGAPG